MKRQSVSSSNIRSIGFENNAMEIEFTNGRVYRYTGPRVREHYDALMSAESVGKHFAAHVRSCPQTRAELVSQ
jgi:KTSC domain